METLIKNDSTYITKKIYLTRCTKSWEQKTGCTMFWKPHLSNYKTYIKQSVYSCKIVKHFTEKCKDSIVPIPSLLRDRIVELT